MRQQGFNLIEIMFALLLLGLVISVSVETSSGDFASYQRVRDTTLARWVAFNQLALVQTAEWNPATGQSAGKTEMGLDKWEWRQEILTTPDPDLRKVKVSVFREGQPQQILAVEVAYMANPNPKMRRVGQ